MKFCCCETSVLLNDKILLAGLTLEPVGQVERCCNNFVDFYYNKYMDNDNIDKTNVYLFISL